MSLTEPRRGLNMYEVEKKGTTTISDSGDNIWGTCTSQLYEGQLPHWDSNHLKAPRIPPSQTEGHNAAYLFTAESSEYQYMGLLEVPKKRFQENGARL